MATEVGRASTSGFAFAFADVPVKQGVEERNMINARYFKFALLHSGHRTSPRRPLEPMRGAMHAPRKKLKERGQYRTSQLHAQIASTGQ